MSIIHEALKKAQNNLKDKPAQAAVQPAQPPVQAQQIPPSVPQPQEPVKNAPAKQTPDAPEQPITEKLSLQQMLPLGKIILALTALVLLMILQPILKSRTSSGSSASSPAVSPAAAPLPSASETRALQTTPAAAPAATIPVAVKPILILNGVSTAGARPMALINNEIYEIGDDVNGLRIVNIAEDGVELIDRDQRIFLKRR